MVRNQSTPGLTFAILAVAFAAVSVLGTISPARAFAADDDAPDATRHLTATADFNHDGIADRAEATAPTGTSPGPGLLTISLGQPDGTFKKLTSLPKLGHAPRAIVTADFNGDGIPDLIVGDEDGALTLFLGDGTGNMTPAGDIDRLGSVVSIAVADFNRDGIPDLAVSDWRSSSVTILFGNGNRSFRHAGSFPLRMPGSMPHVSAADFNGDGLPDLAVVYGEDGDYTFDVMLGDGKGLFTRSPDLSYAKDPNAHCTT